MRKILVVGLLVACLALAMPKEKPVKADLVLRNGRIYTMDAARSWAEAIAVHQGRIVYVGTNEGVNRWVGPATQVMDLKNHFVLPGFIDSHVHPLTSGIALDHLDLTAQNTKEEILKAVKEYAAQHPDLEWIIGHNWQLPVFAQANPQKEWLDEVVPERPVFLEAADGHSAWVNSRALERANITAATPDPFNGRIERDKNGEPSGTLRESAIDLIWKVLPQPTFEEKVLGVQKALFEMNRYGITGFQDASVTEEMLQVYQEAERRRILTARMTAALYADPLAESSIDQKITFSEKGMAIFQTVPPSLRPVLQQIATFRKWREQYKTKYIAPTAVKIFVDGVIEANTAAMLEPYLDRSNDTGILNWEPEKLNPFVQLADAEEFQMHFHAIGNRAVRVSLTALQQARQANGSRDARPLLAHLEVIHPNDQSRFVQLDAIAVFQPLWAYEDEYIRHLTLPKLSKHLWPFIYPIGSVADTGAVLALGSDWNVSSVNPLPGIEVAVTRKDPEPGTESPSFLPEQRLKLSAALAAYTIGSAYANFREKETGSIEVGKSADLVVLERNLFEIPPEQIGETRVLLTLFEGRIVYLSGL